MRTTRKTIGCLLLTLGLGASHYAAGADLGAEVLTARKQFAIWFTDMFRSSKIKAQAEEAGIELDRAKMKSRDGSVAAAAANGLHSGVTVDNVLEKIGAITYDKAFLAKKPPYIGREDNIHTLKARLMNMYMPNALVIGEAGSGKTSMMWQLARELPWNYLVIEIKISGIVAGTRMRGDMEENAKFLAERLEMEAEKTVTNPETGEVAKQIVVGFFDEAHMLEGAGKTEGSSDLSNILKPVLSTGTKKGSRVRFAGATTRDEAPIMLRDSAVARRWGTPIDLKSPDTAEAIAMVEAELPRFEREYGYKCPPKIVAVFVSMAQKHIPGFVLPGPALEMLHTMGSRALLSQRESYEVAKLKAALGRLKIQLEREKALGTPASELNAKDLAVGVEKIEKDLIAAQEAWTNAQRDLKPLLDNNKRLEAEIRPVVENIERLEGEIEKAKAQHLKFALDTTEKDAAKIKRNVELIEHIKNLESELDDEVAKRTSILANRTHPEVTMEQALEAIAIQTNQPIEVVSRSLEDTHVLIAGTLARAVPGQGLALKQIGQAIAKGEFRLGRRAKAVVLVVDEPGQGGAVARALDEALSGAKNNEELRESYLKTMTFDFLTMKNFAFASYFEQLAKRSDRIIEIRNLEYAPPEVLAQLLKIFKEGRLNLGDLDQARWMDFTGVTFLLHLAGSPQNLAGDALIGTLEQQQAAFFALYRPPASVFQGLTDKSQIMQVAGQVMNNVQEILRHTELIVHLHPPSLRNLKRILEQRVSAGEEFLNEILVKRSINPIVIKIQERASLQMATLAGGIEGIEDVFQKNVEDLIAKAIQPAVGPGGKIIPAQIQGGELVTVKYDGDKFYLDIVRKVQ